MLPIADRHAGLRAAGPAALDAAGLRAEVDDRQEKVNYKIREAQLQKIPYMLVVGDREVATARSRCEAVQRATWAPGRWTSFVTDALAEVALQSVILEVFVALMEEQLSPSIEPPGPPGRPAPHQRAHSRP